MRNYNRFLCFLFCAVCIAASSIAQVTITMEKKGDVYYIPGKINNLPLKFIFDTGASNVYISLTEALFMLKNGYLSDSDFGDTSYSQIANGAIVENTEVLLKEIEIGSIKINNVKAMVSNTLEAPLLLGQSAIQKLGPIQLDGNILTIANGQNLVSNETVYQLYQRAYLAAESENFEESIKLSIEALDISSDNRLRAELFDNLAYAYYHSGQKEKAIEAINKALGEDFMAEQPAYNLGVYYYEMGQVDKALRALEQFVTRHKNTKNKSILAAGYAYKGDCHSSQGEIKNAEDAYKQSLAIEKNTQASLGLADLYLNTNNFAAAIPLYQYALEFEPNRLSNIKRYHQLGYCLVRTNRGSEAKTAFEKCISALRANNQLIELALHSNDKDMQTSASSFASFACNAQLWVARLANMPSETIYGYEQAISLPGVKEDFVAQDFLTWASAYLVNGNTTQALQKAVEVLDSGLTLLPDNPELLYAASACTEEKSEKHLQYLLKLLNYEYTYKSENFDFGTIYNNIAWNYTLNGMYDKGLPYSETAVIINPEHDYSWETLGQIYFNIGQYDKCINAMSKCIELSPHKYKSAYEYRAKSYEKLGKKKEAKRDLETIKHL